MPMRAKHVVVDGFAGASALVLVVSGFLSALEDSGSLRDLNGDGWVQVISITVFLGTLVVTIHLVLAEMETLRGTQAEALRVLRVAETGRLLGEVDRWCTENPGAVHVQAARNMAQHLSEWVPELVRDIEQFCTGAPKTAAISIQDQSPIHDLLANLAQRLPEGGAWLGITLLEQVKTWTEPDEAFARFAETMRTRGGGGQILVGRIYHFSSGAAERGMTDAVGAERFPNVTLRALSGGSREDLSLLFAPPDDAARRLTPPLGDDCVKQLTDAGYRLICAVSFETRVDGALRAASLYGSGHPTAQILEGRFRNRWRESRPI